MICPDSAPMFSIGCSGIFLTSAGFKTSTRKIEKCVNGVNLAIGNEKCLVSMSIKNPASLNKINLFFEEWLNNWQKPFMINIPHLGVKSLFLVKIMNGQIDYETDSSQWKTTLKLSILSEVSQQGEAYHVRCRGRLSLITISKTFHLTNPTITLIGDSYITLEQHLQYVELGATALSGTGEDLTASIQTEANLNMLDVGEYKIKYSVTDEIGNTLTVYRTINIIQSQNPVIGHTDRILYVVPAVIQEPTIAVEAIEIYVVPAISKSLVTDDSTTIVDDNNTTIKKD